MSYTAVKMDARERALELVDVGLIDMKTMLIACLQYMSLDDVEDEMYLSMLEDEIERRRQFSFNRAIIEQFLPS